MKYKLPDSLTPNRVFLSLLLMLLAAMAIAPLLGPRFSLRTTQKSFTITTNPLPTNTHGGDLPMHMEDMAEMTHYDMGVWVEGEYTVPEDMWITGFSADGTGAAPHNFYVFIKNTSDPWCPENPVAIRSGGTVTAPKPIEFPAPYGIFLKKGIVLTLKAMFGAEQTVSNSLSVHAAYEPAAESKRTKSMLLYMITPAPCGVLRPVFPIPPHSTDASYSTRSKPFVFPEDGTIVSAGTHFHGSYEKDVPNTLRLFLNENEIDAYTTTNVGDGSERNRPLLKNMTPLAVHAGDRLWMEAIFNNPSASVVPEGMAIVGFYFTPHNVNP